MNHRQIKFRIVLGIMSGGMLVALLFHGLEGWGLGKGYPYNTFLSPYLSFTDYSDIIFTKNVSDPYTDPANDYLPFAYISFRLLELLPENIGLIGFLFVIFGGLTLLLIKTLENIVENPWLRVGSSLLLMGLSYPILFCVDRGNTEILMALCVACSLYFVSRGRYLAGTLWLLPAICWKPYTALFLLLLLRQRKWNLVLGAASGFVIITLFSAHFFSGSPKAIWDLYVRMMAFHQAEVWENINLEESSSPWNTYKIGLLMAQDIGLIPPVDFDWDGPLIRTSYVIYVGGTVVFAVFLTGYVWFIEKEFQRCAILSLLFLGMAVPASVDYRMVYACIALAFLVRIKSRRPGDYLALGLIAFTLVPKKLLFFSFLAYPTTPDISIQVILNPLCMLMAMGVLLYDGCRNYDPAWTTLRLQRFFKILGPRKFRSCRRPVCLAS